MKAAKLITCQLLLILTLGSALGQISQPAEVSLNQTNQAAENQAAIQYLNKLAQGKIDLSEDTALSPHCGINKRKIIREQLVFLQNTHFKQGDHFKFEAKKISGDFAAILVRSENKSTPLNTRIHSVALLHRDNQWKPAPIPGSYSNTGYGYEEETETTVRTLEQWMSREKALRESAARKKAGNTFLTSIIEYEKKLNLDKLSQKQAVLNLIKQCRKKNLLSILACMGAGSDELSDTIEENVNIISLGLSNNSTSNEWHLLTKPSVIVQPMKTDAKKKDVVIGFWTPLAKKPARLLYFSTFQAKGKTFTQLPQELKNAMFPENERQHQRWQHRRGDHDELLEKLPAALLKNHPAYLFPDDNQPLVDRFIKALNAHDFSDCLRLLPREGDFFSDAANQKQALTELSNLWGNIERLKTSPLADINLIAEENLALLPLQYAKNNRPGEFQLIKIWLLKESDGWHIVPEKLLHQYANQTIKTTIRKIELKLRSMEEEQREKFSQSLMTKTITLSPPLTLDPVSPEKAEATLTQFRTFLRSKETTSALNQCAVLKGTSSAQTLKTFNYAIRGAADHRDNDYVLGINSAGKWTSISIRTESKTSKTCEYPLYLIVNTEKGPKILLDIDLRHATNKGRRLINSRNLNKLKKALTEDRLAHIQILIDKHEKLAMADIKASVPIKD